MFNWFSNILIKRSVEERNFYKTFGHLNRMSGMDYDSPKKLFELLFKLDKESSLTDGLELLDHYRKISYASNTNGVFYFCLPIVSHILYYIPELESKILYDIVGPNFANGESNADCMIDTIIGGMKFKQK